MACDKLAISATARMKKKPWDLASYSFHFLYEPHFSLDTGQKDLKKKEIGNYPCSGAKLENNCGLLRFVAKSSLPRGM